MAREIISTAWTSLSFEFQAHQSQSTSANQTERKLLHTCIPMLDYRLPRSTEINRCFTGGLTPMHVLRECWGDEVDAIGKRIPRGPWFTPREKWPHFTSVPIVAGIPGRQLSARACWRGRPTCVDIQHAIQAPSAGTACLGLHQQRWFSPSSTKSNSLGESMNAWIGWSHYLATNHYLPSMTKDSPSQTFHRGGPPEKKNMAC